MKKLFILFALILGVALAQSPASTAMQVFDRVVATEVPCSSNEFTAGLRDAYPVSFCGYIDDTLTDINTSWTTEEYRADGYVPAVDWTREPLGNGEMWISSFINSTRTSMAALFMAPGVDGTVIVLVWE